MAFDWREVKAESRAIVHETMGRPAWYSDGMSPPVEITVRYHMKSAFIGDDIEEFSPGMLAQIQRVLVHESEVPMPRKGATITLLDGLVLRVETSDKQGEGYIMCEVSR